MAKRGSAKPLTRKESFIISRKKKDGTPMNEAAGRVIEQLEALNEDVVPDTYGPDDHLSRVLGPEHPGYVRGKPRTCPTRFWGSSSTSGASTSTAPSPGPAGEQIVTLATVFQRLVRTLIPQQASDEARRTMVEFDDILGALTSSVPSSSQPVAPEVAAPDGVDHADAVDDAAADSDGDDCQL